MNFGRVWSVPFVPSNEEPHFFGNADYEIYHDASESLGIEDILLLSKQEFRWDPSGFVEGQHRVLWLRKEVELAPGIEDQWIMTFYNQRANSIQLYLKNGEESYEFVDASGEDLPFGDRDITDRFPSFRLQLEEGKNTILVRVHSDYYLALNSNLMPIEDYINYSNPYYFTLGGFYFVLLLLVLYNALFYASTRDKIYLHYILYVLAAGLDCLRVDHIGFGLFWPNAPWVNFFVDELSRPLFFLALTNYTLHFLGIRNDYNKLYWAIWMCLSLAIIHHTLISRFLPAPYGLLIGSLLIFLWLGLLLAAGVQRLREGVRPVRIFMIGFGSLVLGFVLTYSFYLHWIPGSHLIYFIMFYGISIDAFMFSFALSARLKRERQEKERALQAENTAKSQVIEHMEENEKLLNKVNIELEEKVQERTSELHEANLRLSEQASVIQELNAQLDKENWKLSKEIKSLETSQVLGKNQSYAEVLKVFPNKETCYQFIAQIKWEEGFLCRKCGHTNAGKGPEFLSKRCTKCGTTESVTANTIFHKLKFPIEKAFYITYEVFNRGEAVNLSEVSREIDLNYKTCQRFRDKIEEAIQRFKKEKKTLDSWEELLVDS